MDPGAGKVQFCAKTKENGEIQSESSTKQQHSLVCEIQLHLKVRFQLFDHVYTTKSDRMLEHVVNFVWFQALFEKLDPQKHKNYQLRRNAFSS